MLVVLMWMRVIPLQGRRWRQCARGIQAVLGYVGDHLVGRQVAHRLTRPDQLPVAEREREASACTHRRIDTDRHMPQSASERHVAPESEASALGLT
jgi:hypothetical protein